MPMRRDGRLRRRRRCRRRQRSRRPTAACSPSSSGLSGYHCAMAAGPAAADGPAGMRHGCGVIAFTAGHAKVALVRPAGGRDAPLGGWQFPWAAPRGEAEGLEAQLEAALAAGQGQLGLDLSSTLCSQPVIQVRCAGSHVGAPGVLAGWLCLCVQEQACVCVCLCAGCWWQALQAPGTCASAGCLRCRRRARPCPLARLLCAVAGARAQGNHQVFHGIQCARGRGRVLSVGLRVCCAAPSAGACATALPLLHRPAGRAGARRGRRGCLA